MHAGGCRGHGRACRAQPSPAAHSNSRTRCTAAHHQQQQESAAAAASAAAEEGLLRLLTRRSFAPARFVGPVDVALVPGKRLGLTAARNLAVGELLLVAAPLAVAFGPAGAAPANEELVEQLQQQQLPGWQLQWLRALLRPAASDAAVTGQEPQHKQQQQDPQPAEDAELLALQHTLQRLLQQGPDAATAAAEPAEPAGQQLSVVSVESPFSQEQLQQIVAENAHAEGTEDLGAALMRELEPEAVAGLWGEYALLNHSCAPNTAAVCVGRFLLLRATAPVLAGEELSCSYLGALSLSPVAVRRAFLQGVYGFHCTCPRCLAEQRTFPTQYYPADNALLGLQEPSAGSGSSSSSGVVSSVAQAIAWLLGRDQQQQQQAGTGPSKPQPSSQHGLLLELHQAVLQELRPAVADATAADSRRQEQQLQLLAAITGRVDAAVAAAAAATAADPALREQQGAVSRWLLAAFCPLLQLQVEVIELLLASGDLPLDDTQPVSDAQGAPSSRSSNPALAAAGAAAAARLSLSQRRSSSSSARQRAQGSVGAWLSALWASLTPAGAAAAGPVTKLSLLGLYAESLGRCLEALDAVARGSEAHVTAAIKHADAVRRLAGVESEATALAETLCARAHAARYGVLRGPEGQALRAALISARRRRLLGQSLAKKLGVLAWESSIMMTKQQQKQAR